MKNLIKNFDIRFDMVMHVLTTFLILLPHWLLVNADSFSFTSWNITNTSNPNGVDQTLVQKYVQVANSATFQNPIENNAVAVFSEAFKNCYWCYPSDLCRLCFQIGGPFISANHPISLAPYPPCLMNMTMELYTRENPTTPFVFDPNDLSRIDQSNFNNNSETKFLIEGYTAGDGSGFKTAILPALLAHSDCNVFIVNWLIGSDTTYEQAVANTRMAGAITGCFIEKLKNITGLALSLVHLIGHSLGAHICGYAGEYLLGQVARISGLDPAGPFYQNTDTGVRLSTSDAKFVDITHTNAGSILAGYLGIDQKMGHIDFYPNGGSDQPGCDLTNLLWQRVLAITSLPLSLTTLMTVDSLISCSHGRSVLLYAESIWNSFNSSCQFSSYACSDYNTFRLGLCRTNCSSNGEKCAEMGFNSIEYAAAGYLLPAPYKFYLTTNGASPYCIN